MNTDKQTISSSEGDENDQDNQDTVSNQPKQSNQKCRKHPGGGQGNLTQDGYICYLTTCTKERIYENKVKTPSGIENKIKKEEKYKLIASDLNSHFKVINRSRIEDVFDVSNRSKTAYVAGRLKQVFEAHTHVAQLKIWIKH